jgi:hypothetical protein
VMAGFQFGCSLAQSFRHFCFSQLANFGTVKVGMTSPRSALAETLATTDRTSPQIGLCMAENMRMLPQ